MPTIQRLTDSCLLVTTDSDATLIDPGFHTFGSDDFDLDTLGDVSRVLITHAHPDHANPDFVRWLIDRGTDVVVYSNQAVAGFLGEHDIAVETTPPSDVSVEDVLHGAIPNGATPPNRSFTVGDLLTHPGDSREPTSSGQVLALPLIVPWDSARGAVLFAERLGPRRVVPIHDFYLTPGGREWARGIVGAALEPSGIEMVDLDWGQSFTP